MNKISTYIQNPGEITILSDYSFDTLIVDLPFCSVRAHAPYDWHNEELELLQKLNATTIALNLDGIYSNHELTIIKSTIESRTLTQFFTAVRIQDPGLILWIKDNYPNLKIQLNPETGLQNTPGIQSMFELGIQSFICNHETPASTLADMLNKNPSFKFEILVQGPILIQYSRRRFLSDLYESDQSNTIRLDAEDADLPERQFTFLDTPFGHFMFAQFHRSLALYRDKLQSLDTTSWLIDSRGESINYFKTALKLYSELSFATDDIIKTLVNTLKAESNKPQKPGFFLSNNTDYDWRDETNIIRSNPVGHIISKVKTDATCIEFFDHIDLNQALICINTDQTETLLDVTTICNLAKERVHSITPFTPYLLPAQKGIQVKGKLYLKDS